MNTVESGVCAIMPVNACVGYHAPDLRNHWLLRLDDDFATFPCNTTTSIMETLPKPAPSGSGKGCSVSCKDRTVGAL